MATVFWRGKQWVAQWYRPDGSRPKRGTGLSEGKRDAKRAADEMEAKDRKETSDSGRKFEEIISRAGAEAKAGRLSLKRAEEYIMEMRRVSDPSFSILSLDEYLAGWIKGKKARVTEKTANAHNDMLGHFTAAFGLRTMRAPLGELTRAQIESALTSLQKKGLRGSTINHHLRALRLALKQAVEDGLLVRNVSLGIPAMPETDTVQRAPFTAEEVRRMIDHPKTSDEWKGMILIGAHTGLRLGDILSLTRSHIDGTRIVIRPKKTAKTNHVVRIPLTPPVLAWIKDRKGAFFPQSAPKPRPTISGQFSAIMERANVAATMVLPGNFPATRSFHSLRHTFATWLAEADIHADVRQKLTGHTRAETHARYSHHDEALDRAVRALPDLAGSGADAAHPPHLPQALPSSASP